MRNSILSLLLIPLSMQAGIVYYVSSDRVIPIPTGVSIDILISTPPLTLNPPGLFLKFILPLAAQGVTYNVTATLNGFGGGSAPLPSSQFNSTVGIDPIPVTVLTFGQDTGLGSVWGINNNVAHIIVHNLGAAFSLQSFYDTPTSQFPYSKAATVAVGTGNNYERGTIGSLAIDDGLPVIASAPEPATFMLLGIGLIGAYLFKRS